MLASEPSKNLLVSELARVRLEYQFLLVGYVVMPEHVHLVMSQPQEGEVSTAVQMLKQRVSWKMRRSEHLLQKRPEFSQETELRSFWQARYYDFNLYKKHKLREKLQYMHANPVLRGLVQNPGDWPWSSWGFYETGEVGLVPIDVV